MARKIFIICPVRRVTKKVKKKLEEYVTNLEAQGNKVHLPHRDTEQNDPTGGYEICKTNAWAMINAHEIHIWYDEKSGGSKFDMGIAFLLSEIFIYSKKIVIINESEVVDESKKSFFKVLKQLQEKTKNFWQ